MSPFQDFEPLLKPVFIIYTDFRVKTHPDSKRGSDFFFISQAQVRRKSEPAPAEVLYRRGRTSTMCTLILTGKAIVLAGRDGALVVLP